AINALLSYINIHKGNFVVIIDDMSRFARDTVIHFTLKDAVTKAGCSLECINTKIEDTPDGKFLETIFSATAELERNNNKQRVINRMQARLELGYWSFDAPPGYKYVIDAIHGKLLVKSEPNATIIKDALEGFASERFETKVDVLTFLKQHKFSHRSKTGKVYLEQVNRLLTRPLYAGIIVYPKWNIEKRKGQHEALVSEETFNKIQARLHKKNYPQQKVINEDFPLRGFVLCPECKKAFTASWSSGRKDKYPYYRCINPKCNNGQKSIKRKDIEAIFESSLSKAIPSQQIIKLTEAITLDIYNKKLKEVGALTNSKENDLKELEKNIEKATERLIQVEDETTHKSIEKKIAEWGTRKLYLEDEITRHKNHNIDFGTALNRVMEFVSNPYERWVNGDIRQKQLVQKLVFVRPFVIDVKNGIGTAELSLPFRLLQETTTNNTQLVEVPGIEPGSASLQL
ncbi:MAG: recombinase family protein, partial [bacterium]